MKKEKGKKKKDENRGLPGSATPAENYELQINNYELSAMACFSLTLNPFPGL